MIYVLLVLLISCFDSYVNAYCAINVPTIDCDSTSTLSEINNLLPTIRAAITELNYAGTKDTKLTTESFKLPELQALIIHDTNIQEIQEEAFANLDFLIHLTLEENKLYSEIQPKTFIGLVQLTELTITKCPVEVIKKDTFQGLADLETLNLQDNQIRVLEVDALASLQNLKRLKLNDNQIKELPMEIFLYKTPKLAYLDLHNNKIGKISQEDFITNQKTKIVYGARFMQRLSTIETIILAGNPNFLLQPNNFEIESLVELDLSYMGLTIIPQSHVFGSKLEHLKLDLNNLTKLTNGVFDNLINLKSLSIKHNLINSIDENCFSNMTELTDLDLSENQINELSKIYLKSLLITGNEIVMIQPKTFANLFSLTTLDLSKNKLQTIDKGVFDARNKDNYSKLTLVVINYNVLTRLGNDSFLPLTRVTHLDLRSNKIMEIEVGAFRTMEMVEIISLRFNLLETIPNGLFTNLANLEEIDLYGNRLKILPDYIFSNLQSVKSINLNYNNLNYLSPLALKDSSVRDLTIYFNNVTFIEDEFFINSQLKRFVFYKNPIQCKCYFELLNILQELNIFQGFHAQSKTGDIPVCTNTNLDTCVKDPNLNLDIFKFYFHMIKITPKRCIDPDLC
ncbi:carboxypeptidase N subunit 2-like [Chrysoperla carnea]|uniref:carboxypeptidase N subunit 2-like n=1 Tax=Chrysoperla carnea TaxID=189513 RepID=UPI001D06E5CC|nr:carboxypeptidase N subunit 2-like [Chrysoperla carnea]